MLVCSLLLSMCIKRVGELTQKAATVMIIYWRHDNHNVNAVKAVFHHSSKLQTWLSTCVSVSKARRKQVERMSKVSRKPAANLLKT